MTIIQPKLEVKMNTKLEDVDLQFNEIDKDKVFLSQFDGELDDVHITVNDSQFVMKIDELKAVVDMLHSQAYPNK